MEGGERERGGAAPSWRPTCLCVSSGDLSDFRYQLLLSITSPVPTALHPHCVLCNPLKTKRRPLYLKTQSVPRSKHFSSRLYKNQSVYAVSGTSRCLFSDKHKPHKYSVARAYICWTLNCWCIAWPVGIKMLILSSKFHLRTLTYWFLWRKDIVLLGANWTSLYSARHISFSLQMRYFPLLHRWQPSITAPVWSGRTGISRWQSTKRELSKSERSAKTRLVSAK